MSGFQQILGQSHAVWLLQEDMARDKVKHAYLLTGPPGVGKKTLALAFARALFCLQPVGGRDSCGLCRNCRRLDHGQHPDVHFVRPEGKKTIGIEQIREIGRQLGMKTVEGGPRVVLIDQAGLMTTDASNCLLKNLEEPPAGTVFLLTADGQGNLLPTIVSRCQTVHLNALEKEDVREILERQPELTSEDARVLADLSTGSAGEVLDKQRQLLEAQEWMDLAAFLDGAGGRHGALGLTDGLEKLDCLDALLDCWISDFRQALLAAVLNGRDSLICRESLQQQNERFLMQGLDALLDIKRKRENNVNTRLALDVMLQKMFDALEDNRGGYNGRR